MIFINIQYYFRYKLCNNDDYVTKGQMLKFVSRNSRKDFLFDLIYNIWVAIRVSEYNFIKLNFRVFNVSRIQFNFFRHLKKLKKACITFIKL